MASRKYKPKDQEKFVTDQMAELRERKIADAQTIVPLHPEGAVGALREMMKDPGFTRDQSQAWIEHGKEGLKQRALDNKEYNERREEEIKRGSYE